MSTLDKSTPVLFTIFGAGGDLVWRKLMPAIFDLYLDKHLSEQFTIVGLDIKEMGDDDYKKHLLDGVNKFSRKGKADKK